jgi:hypothetical protein
MRNGVGGTGGCTSSSGHAVLGAAGLWPWGYRAGAQWPVPQPQWLPAAASALWRRRGVRCSGGSLAEGAAALVWHYRPRACAHSAREETGSEALRCAGGWGWGIVCTALGQVAQCDSRAAVEWRQVLKGAWGALRRMVVAGGWRPGD